MLSTRMKGGIMGYRFDLQTENWIAYLIDTGAPFPGSGYGASESDAWDAFLKSTAYDYFSSTEREVQYQRLISTVQTLRRQLRDPEKPNEELLAELRSFFRNRDWTALLVPSGRGEESDKFLCSGGFLRSLVNLTWKTRGLILQLLDRPTNIFALTDVFPAFKTALAEHT